MSKLPALKPKDLARVVRDLGLFWIARKAATLFIFHKPQINTGRISDCQR